MDLSLSKEDLAIQARAARSRRSISSRMKSPATSAS